jgi:hypothetical protein
MVEPAGQLELMQLGVCKRVDSRFQAAVFAVAQSVAPATGMLVVVPQFVDIAFCSIATDQLPCAMAEPAKTTRAARAKAGVKNFFMVTVPFSLSGDVNSF